MRVPRRSSRLGKSSPVDSALSSTKAFRKRKEVGAREAVESISFHTMEDWTGRWHKRHPLALDMALCSQGLRNQYGE